MRQTSYKLIQEVLFTIGKAFTLVPNNRRHTYIHLHTYTYMICICDSVGAPNLTAVHFEDKAIH